MTSRADFSDAEWGVVMAGVVAPGVAVMLLDPGVVSTMKEMRAMVETLMGAAARYPGVELIAAISTKSPRGDDPLPIDAKTPVEQQLDRTLADVRSALRMVDAKATPDEARAFRRLVLEVGKAAAQSSGNGIFGIGAKLSPLEKRYLERLGELLV